MTSKLAEIKQLYTRFDGPNPPSEDLFQWIVARMEKLENVARAAEECRDGPDEDMFKQLLKLGKALAALREAK